MNSITLDHFNASSNANKLTATSSVLTTYYQGKKYYFSCFDELWQFYRIILSSARTLSLREQKQSYIKV